MFILDTVTRTLEVVLAGAITANQLQCVADFVDGTPTTFTPGCNPTNTNSTTAVTLVPAPAASTQRQVKCISIRNRDTAPATVTLSLNDNGTKYERFKSILSIGDTLVWTDTEGWSQFDTSGNAKCGLTGPAGATGGTGSTGGTGATGPAGPGAGNKLINSNFRYAQIQTPGTLTTKANDAYGADMFRSASAGVVQFQQLNARTTRIKNLNVDYYGAYKCTTTGKALVAQPMLSINSPGGRDGNTATTVTLSVKMMASAAKTWHLGLLVLSTSGTIDIIPANLVTGSWLAGGSDPVWATNLSLLAPTATSSPTGATITTGATSGVCSVSGTQFDQFTATFTLPTTYDNLIPVIYADAAMATSEFIYTSEWDFYGGSSSRTYVEPNDSDNLLQCQAYFWKSCAVDTIVTYAPGTNCSLQTCGASTSGFCIFFGNGMRAIPTVTIYDGAGNSGKITAYSGGWSNNNAYTVLQQFAKAGYIQANFTNFQCEATANANL